MMERPLPFISRVRLRNYRSIASCNVELDPLTFLIGPNGTGKSNFLQALTFISRAASTTPAEAIASLGGLSEIVRKVPEPAAEFSIEISARVPLRSDPTQWAMVHYGFEIRPSLGDSQTPFEVTRETCSIDRSGGWRQFLFLRSAYPNETEFPDTRLGEIAAGVEPDRLILPLAASIQAEILVPLFNRLTSMQFYNRSLDALRQPSRPNERAALDRRGEHLADVVGALAQLHPNLKTRLDSYLSAIAPGITGIDRLTVGDYATVKFRARSSHGNRDVEFGPAAVSDGTVRASGVLAALFQPNALDGRIPLIGIEEPEIALHPAAAGVLFDALTEASARTQILITTQS